MSFKNVNCISAVLSNVASIMCLCERERERDGRACMCFCRRFCAFISINSDLTFLINLMSYLVDSTIMPKKRTTRVNRRAKPKAPGGDLPDNLELEDKRRKLNVFLQDFEIEGTVKNVRL